MVRIKPTTPAPVRLPAEQPQRQANIARRELPTIQPAGEKESQQLIPAYYGKLTETMAGISSQGAEKTDKGKLLMKRERVLLQIDAVINNIPVVWGINAHKLLSWGMGAFILANPALRTADISKVTVNYGVAIPLVEFFEAMGYDVIPHDNSKAEKQRAAAVLRKARQRTRLDLERLHGVKATWIEGVKKGGKAIARATDTDATDKNFMNYSIIGSHGIDKQFIYMTFDPLFVRDYLLLLPQTKYHKALTKVKGRNAYLIGLKLQKHFFMKGNIDRHINDRLKVSNVLAATDLPTIDYIEGTRNEATGKREGGADPGHWDKRIKERMEEGLDELYKVGFLGFWGYKGGHGKELTDEEATVRNARAWEAQYLHFNILGNFTIEE